MIRGWCSLHFVLLSIIFCAKSFQAIKTTSKTLGRNATFGRGHAIFTSYAVLHPLTLENDYRAWRLASLNRLVGYVRCGLDMPASRLCLFHMEVHSIFVDIFYRDFISLLTERYIVRNGSTNVVLSILPFASISFPTSWPTDRPTSFPNIFQEAVTFH